MVEERLDFYLSAQLEDQFLVQFCPLYPFQCAYKSAFVMPCDEYFPELALPQFLAQCEVSDSYAALGSVSLCF
jgi:hypothetical protein